jgi:hypothetical protein
MCATAAKSATKAKPKTKAKKPSPAQIEANRRNAEKSCGPKTDQGKAKSRFNALKHGMTAETVLLPGDDGQAFANRLRYLQDDLQPRNGLEGVLIERLVGDLWKADRSERSSGMRISFRLRHSPVDQSLKNAEEAIERGQHLLWQAAFPLPVGRLEGEAKGALAKFPLADVPGDPLHPARLLLKLESTVAGCDWLIARWRDLRFRLEIPGTWVMADVWTMVRLLGKTAIEMKDDFQVLLLVLASLAIEPPEPVPSQPGTLAEAVSALSRDDRLSRVVAGITRLCEPFQQALARMPLDKLAPENEEQARQRLFAVVDQELGRIGRIRAMLQKIADADLAEAPVRLAFETGTEGDRHRRYVLSYERLVNRRIDTFLKVRKASGSGELDLVELDEVLGRDKLVELVESAGIMTRLDPGDLRSSDGRGRETLAQHGKTRAQEPRDPFSIPSSGSAQVSEPAETPDRRSPSSPTVSDSSVVICDDDFILRNEAIAAPDDSGSRGWLPQADAPTSEDSAPAAHWTSQLDPSHPASDASQADRFEPSLQNESAAAPVEPARIVVDERAAIIAEELTEGETRPEDAPHGLEARAKQVVESINVDPPGSRLQSPTETRGEKGTCDGDSMLRNEPTAAPDDPLSDVGQAAVAPPPPTVTPLANLLVPGNTGVTDPGHKSPAAARLTKLLVPMDRAALALLTAEELKARRWAMFQAKRKLERRQ